MDYEKFDNTEQYKTNTLIDEKCDYMIYWLKDKAMDSVRMQDLMGKEWESVMKRLLDKKVIEIKNFGDCQIIGLTKEYREKNNIRTGK